MGRNVGISRLIIEASLPKSILGGAPKPKPTPSVSSVRHQSSVVSEEVEVCGWWLAAMKVVCTHGSIHLLLVL